MYMCKYCGSTFTEHLTTCPNCAGNSWWKVEETKEEMPKTPLKEAKTYEPPDDADNTEKIVTQSIVTEEKESVFEAGCAVLMNCIDGIFYWLEDSVAQLGMVLILLAMTVLIRAFYSSTLTNSMDTLEKELNVLFETQESDTWESPVVLDENGARQGWMQPFNAEPSNTTPNESYKNSKKNDAPIIKEEINVGTWQAEFNMGTDVLKSNE